MHREGGKRDVPRRSPQGGKRRLKCRQRRAATAGQGFLLDRAQPHRPETAPDPKKSKTEGWDLRGVESPSSDRWRLTGWPPRSSNHRPPSPRRPRDQTGRPATPASVSCHQEPRRPHQTRPPPRTPKPSAREAEPRQPRHCRPWRSPAFWRSFSDGGKGGEGGGGGPGRLGFGGPPVSPRAGATREEGGLFIWAMVSHSARIRHMCHRRRGRDAFYAEQSNRDQGWQARRKFYI
jgi:hypothetical protein